jgi:hypothetical protein
MNEPNDKRIPGVIPTVSSDADHIIPSTVIRFHEKFVCLQTFRLKSFRKPARRANSPAVRSGNSGFREIPPRYGDFEPEGFPGGA